MIRRDIARTYPEHALFKQKDGVGQEALFNVMKAYSVHDREVMLVMVMVVLVMVVMVMVLVMMVMVLLVMVVMVVMVVMLMLLLLSYILTSSGWSRCTTASR